MLRCYAIYLVCFSDKFDNIRRIVFQSISNSTRPFSEELLHSLETETKNQRILHTNIEVKTVIKKMPLRGSVVVKYIVHHLCTEQLVTKTGQTEDENHSYLVQHEVSSCCKDRHNFSLQHSLSQERQRWVVHRGRRSVVAIC